MKSQHPSIIVLYVYSYDVFVTKLWVIAFLDFAHQEVSGLK